jgi:hypothetical protein
MRAGVAMAEEIWFFAKLFAKNKFLLPLAQRH